MSTLYQEVESYLKDGGEVWDLAHSLDIAFVETSTEDERRWYNIKHTIFQRKTIVNQQPVQFEDEFVLVVHCEPATEMQLGGDFPEPEVFAVEPYVIEVVRYRPV